VEELDKYFLGLAIDEAWKFQGLTYPNPAVGAVVAKDGQLISCECHKKAGDPHAEVLAIKSAFIKLHPDRSKTEYIKILQISSEIHEYLYENHDNIFADCDIYSTLEPCNHYGKTPPCSHLISKLRFKRVVFGSSDEGVRASGGAEFLSKNCIEVIPGVLKDRCDELLAPFLAWQNSRFVFFKYAQTLNGVIAPGKISSDESFEMVHKLRDKIELLVIGGNTVRNDRPTLDSRIVDGKAPDVLIYSRRDDLDRSIPLFGVPNREVIITNKLNIPQKYRFIMIEGGSEMLKATMDICDYFLIFVSPKLSDGVFLRVNDIKFDYLSSFRVDCDQAIWARRKK
jgi:diaminohydroxyphosphoribosylaminopyrimidine deaminase/5-amino-6-(5-phosphoribosylamino)uracil reductase